MLAIRALTPTLSQRERRKRRDLPLWERVGVRSGLARDRRGVVALEFALTGVVFLGLLLFVAALGVRLYVQSALDYASSRAARLLAVDSTQSRSASAAQFRSVSFCPLLSAFLVCSNITISLQPVTDYLNGSSPGGSGPPPFNPGQGGGLMLLRVSYALPVLSWPVPMPGGGGFASASATSSYPYQNEY